MIEAPPQELTPVHLYPREVYEERIKHIKQCPFCRNEHTGECGVGVIPEYILTETNKWLWIVNPYPYWRYHTIIVPKRHITRIEEITLPEFGEMQDLTAHALERYNQAHLSHLNQTPITNYVFFWRFRQGGQSNKFAHLHIHLAPDKARMFDPILDSGAHNTNIMLLKEGTHVSNT